MIWHSAALSMMQGYFNNKKNKKPIALKVRTNQRDG